LAIVLFAVENSVLTTRLFTLPTFPVYPSNDDIVITPVFTVDAGNVVATIPVVPCIEEPVILENAIVVNTLVDAIMVDAYVFDAVTLDAKSVFPTNDDTVILEM